MSLTLFSVNTENTHTGHQRRQDMKRNNLQYFTSFRTKPSRGYSPVFLTSPNWMGTIMETSKTTTVAIVYTVLVSLGQLYMIQL